MVSVLEGGTGKVVSQDEIMKHNVAELQELLQKSYIRIEELIRENENLKKQLFGDEPTGC
jgi:N-dimethylarginine dimethylaminohydrolase